LSRNAGAYCSSPNPQPRRYVHVVILGSEERQPLMVDDRPSVLRPSSGSAEIGAVSGIVDSGRK
jgi:hypothetical protein